MRKKHVLAYSHFLAALLCLTALYDGNAACQSDSNAFAINIGHTAGIGPCRDKGISPRLYHGIVTGPSLGAGIRRGLWRYELEVSLHGGIYDQKRISLKKFNLVTINGNVEAILAAGRTIPLSPRWRIEADGLLYGIGILSYNSGMMNASTAMTLLLCPQLGGTVGYSLRSLEFWAGLWAAPAGWSLRPGYSYMDNFTATTDEIEAFGGEYRWQCSAFPLFRTSVGVTLTMPNGNRATLRYDWHYMRTGDTKSYEEALHSLNLRFEIKLN